MKYLILAMMLPISYVQAQSSTGPGVKDEPPTAAVNVQDRKLNKPKALPANKIGKPMEHIEPATEGANEEGPSGEAAQAAAKKNEFDVSDKEIKKKQKGQ